MAGPEYLITLDADNAALDDASAAQETPPLAQVSHATAHTERVASMIRLQKKKEKKIGFLLSSFFFFLVFPVSPFKFYQ